MTTDDLVRRALREIDRYQPSPDLFARVRRSIDETAAHRRRLRRWATGSTLFAAVVAGAVASAVEVDQGAVVVVPAVLETAVIAVMAALVVVVGPAIRRFGRLFLAGTLGKMNDGGKGFLAVIDLAYAMLFGGIALVSISMEDFTMATRPLAPLLEFAALRIGLLALAIGLMHGTALFITPMIGLVLASGRWRSRLAIAGRVPVRTTPEGRTDRVAGWVALLLMAAGLGAAGIALLIAAAIGLGG